MNKPNGFTLVESLVIAIIVILIGIFLIGIFILPILATRLSPGTVILQLLLWLAGATLLWIGGRFIAKIPRATFWRSLLTYFLAWVAAIAAFVVVMAATFELSRNWHVAEVLRRLVALLASLLVTWLLIKTMFKTSFRKAILAWLPTLAILLIAVPLRMTILREVFSDLVTVESEYVHRTGELSPTEALQIMKEFATKEVPVPTVDGKPIPPGSNVRAMIVRNVILGLESKPGVTWDESLVNGMVLDLVRAEESYSTNPERIGDWYVFGYRGAYGGTVHQRRGIWVDAKTRQVGFYEQLDPKPKLDAWWWEK